MDYDYEKDLYKLEVYMHYFVTSRSLELAYGTYPTLSYEEFFTKPIDPWTGTTKYYEWCWKFKFEYTVGWGTKQSPKLKDKVRLLDCVHKVLWLTGKAVLCKSMQCEFKSHQYLIEDEPTRVGAPC